MPHAARDLGAYNDDDDNERFAEEEARETARALGLAAGPEENILKGDERVARRITTLRLNTEAGAGRKKLKEQEERKLLKAADELRARRLREAYSDPPQP